MRNGGTWPCITIITASYNQGEFLEETIRSVLLQGYPNLEYIIVDGGSTDQSVDIIRRYERWLTYWVSEPDRGQSHAINKGVERSTGDWLAWINSDDWYLPGVFARVAQLTGSADARAWIVGTTIEHFGRGKRSLFVPRYLSDRRFEQDQIGGSWLDFVRTRKSGTSLPQPSSFWSHKAWLDAGPLDESFHYAMDHEFYGRLGYHGYRPFLVNEPFAVFRRHESSKSRVHTVEQWNEEVKAVDKWLQRVGGDEAAILSTYRGWLLKDIARQRLFLGLPFGSRFYRVGHSVGLW